MKLRETRRVKAVALLEAGVLTKGVAHIVKASTHSVIRWKKLAKMGQDLSDRPRSGRPSAITPLLSKAIVKDIRGRPGVSIRDIVKNINHRMKADSHVRRLSMLLKNWAWSTESSL